MSDKLNDYKKFVDYVTSDPSKDKAALLERIEELYSTGCDVARFATAGIGMASEAGEYNEILKKMLFQGKPYNEENVFHLKREMGDIIFYWMEACLAHGFDPMEVIDENIKKLSARYPDGFEIARSENRKEGDL